MSKIKILNQEATEKILNMEQVIEAVEKAYLLKSQGKTELWPMIFHEFERGKADMDIKSGYLKGEEVFGLKVVSWFGENPGKNLPALTGTILVLDSTTGLPLGVLNASHVTGMRTGAAGAIGAKYLARKESESLLMVGTGHQSLFQIAAALTAMDNIKKVRICNPIHKSKAESMKASIKGDLVSRFLSRYEKGSEAYDRFYKKLDIEYEAAEDLEDAAGKSDIIITATPSRKPLIMKDWVRKGTHFSCVGADMEGKQEIDESIYASARVFVDDMEQAVNVGETEIPIRRGIISREDLLGEIGNVIAGNVIGRKSDDDITVFDSTGIALQDLMTSKLALDIAYKKGLGAEAEL